ncbi:MAG: hypothetical protein PVJ98_07355 [Akkermansiaceae bacterium]|jgi:hypothetical protein
MIERQEVQMGEFLVIGKWQDCLEEVAQNLPFYKFLRKICELERLPNSGEFRTQPRFQ